jgi:hypothetical protein
MPEPSGNVELRIVEISSGEEEALILTAKDFHPERRAMLDDDVLGEHEEIEYVAYANAMGYDFKVVAVPPNTIDLEDDAEEIRIEIIENNLEFVEPDEEEDYET